MSWDAELDDYIGQITETAEVRLVLEREWLSSGLDDEVAGEIGADLIPEVRPMFDRFADGHPASCAHITDKLAAVRATVTSNLHDLGDVRDVIAGWRDNVAGAFRDYIGKCETAVVSRCDYVDAMVVVANYQQEILTRVRRDVRSVAEATLTALRRAPEDGGGFSLGDALTLAGAIAVVGAAAITPVPDDAAAAVVAVNLVNRVTGSLEAGGNAASALSESESGSPRTADILIAAFTALDAIRDAATEHEDAVVAALHALLDGYAENEAVINPARGPVDPNQADPDYLRTIDLNAIRQTGTTDLPAMVSLYTTAAAQVDGIEENEPHAFEGALHEPPLVPWQKARDTLHAVFERTAATLADTGITLVAIADTWEDGEATNEELSSNITRLLDGG